MVLEEIKTGTIDDWIAGLQSKGLEPKTVHNMWKMFRAIMNWYAQQDDAQPRKWYPALPVLSEDEQRWFTQDETRQIVEAAADGRYATLFYLAGASGLRAGELFGLHVEDLNLDRCIIRVRRSVWCGREASVKTKKGYRDVWIDSATAQVLKQYLGDRTSGRVFQTRNRHTPGRWKCCQASATYYLRQAWHSPWRVTRFSPRASKPFPAEWCPSDFIKRQIGHSNLRTTSGYTHFEENFERDIVEKLAEKFASWTPSKKLDSVAIGLN